MARRPQPDEQSWSRPAVLILFAASLTFRHVALAIEPAQLQADPDGYREIARNLERTHVYGCAPRSSPDAGRIARPGALTVPTAYRAPLYPLLIAYTESPTGGAPGTLGIVQVLLGVATVMLTVHLARLWGLRRRTALAAALLILVDPILIQQAGLAMSETLAALLAVVALIVLSQAGSMPAAATTRPARDGAAVRCRPAVWAGAALGACVLCRPTFMIWLLACGLALVLRAGSWRRRLLYGASYVFGASLLLMPWTLRNLLVFGQPICTTTHGGFTLVLANNPQFYAHLREQGWWAPWDSRSFQSELQAEFFRSADVSLVVMTASSIKLGQDQDFFCRRELAFDRYCYDTALENIRRQPGMFLQACLFRLSRLWGVCPLAPYATETWAHRALRYAVGLGYSIQFVLAAWGAWRIGRGWLRGPWIWGLLLVLSFTLVHTLYWTDLRMRAPLAGIIALSAAVGAADALQRLSHKRFSLQPLRPIATDHNLP